MPVGSIICDTGLILGVACLISPLPLPRRIVNRQGWIQLGSGILLVLACWIPSWWEHGSPLAVFRSGGHLPQIVGIFFLVLLGTYLWLTVTWAIRDRSPTYLGESETDIKAPTLVIVLKFSAWHCSRPRLRQGTHTGCCSPCRSDEHPLSHRGGYFGSFWYIAAGAGHCRDGIFAPSW